MRTLFARVLVTFILGHIISNGFACEQNLPLKGSRDDVLIIVNNNAKDSCEIGRYYAEQRGLGQYNIFHVQSPAAFFVTWTEFKQLRDQILRNLQRRIVQENPGIVLATCSGYESPYYCPDVVNQISQYTHIRYIVTTKGIPSRMTVDGSGSYSPGEATVVDNYLKYWLLNYFTNDATFGGIAYNRSRAFDDGRGMRIVNPATDREMIIGRIDGLSLDATKAMIDRTIAAEANGIFGKVYSYTNFALYNASSGMVWKNYNAYPNKIYSGGTDPWRYQFGIFNETLQECSDYNNPSNYLQYSSGSVAGKSPQQCTVKISVSPKITSFGTNDPPPATSSSRQPLADDSLIYMGHLDGQAAGGGNFTSFTNWRRDATCSNTLCENLPISEQDACRTASIDVFKEIDTRCVGVADGFIGYNYQSFPVSFLHIAPTGWQTGTSSNFRQGRSAVRTDIGANDNFSLWYQATEEITQPLCYSGYDFFGPPTVACNELISIYFNQPYNFSTTQTSNPAMPHQYRLKFKYKAENLNHTLILGAYLNLTELATGKVVTYDRVNATPTIAAGITTGWLDSEAILTVNHADTEHNANWDGTYRSITVNISGNAQFNGAVGLDDFSLALITPAGDIPVPLVNPSFADGHKTTTTGDHAANYLSRLNGVAFWGSMSHHASLGHSFASHTLESMIYFMRGLPLGDAVWFAEDQQSGILYGDPLYSPIAVKLGYLTPSSSNQFVQADSYLALHGSAVNGNDPSRVSTIYTISYCRDLDFYLCDRQGTWNSTGLSGTGGQRDMNFGDWNASVAGPGPATIRLAVSSTNQLTGRSQTFNDYQSVIFYNDTSDFDNDGLTDAAEIELGTNATIADTDSDGLLDGEEVNIYHSNPRKADTDGDSISDKTEISIGMNPIINDVTMDLDGDGVNNGIEYASGTNPNNPASFPHIKIFYVDNTNISGIEDGTAQHPFTDLTVAYNTSNHGDTLHIAAGDYSFTPSTGKRGLHIIGASQKLTRITTNSSLYASSWFEGEIQNLQITTGSYGITLNNSQNVVINNVVIHSQFNSIFLAGSFNIQITNVEMHTGSYGLYISNSRDIHIDHCIIAGVAGSSGGVGVYYTSYDIVSNVVLDQCTITNFDYGLLIYNYINQPSLTIQNSIIDAEHNSNNFTTISAVTVRNSLLRDTTFAGINGNLTGDPRFVNAVTGDYHLLPDSPAVATGDPATPLNHEPLINTRVNMGYYGGTAEATTQSDQDGDGLPDGYEVASGLDPVTANTFGDADADGFTDIEEFWEGTSPMNATIKPAYRYVVLNTRLSSAQIVSLVSDNTLTVNGQTYTLGQFVSTSISGLVPGTLLSSTGPISVGGSNKYTDTAVPFRLAGQLFVMPHQRNNHEIQLYSPYADANVQVITAGAEQNLVVARGSVVTHRITGSNNQSTVIISNRPLLVAHAAYTGSSTYSGDTNIVPPAMTEIMGIKSSNVYFGAAENGTQATVYTSDGLQRTYTLSSGQRVSVSVGNNDDQGRGAALRIVANKPIGAIQANDGDGNEQTAFLNASWLVSQVSLPTGTQYIAFACMQSADVTVNSPTGAVLASGHCTPANNNPGKLYLGRTSNRTTYPAGSVINSTVPVYMYYEDAQFNEERNIFGHY